MARAVPISRLFFRMNSLAREVKKYRGRVEDVTALRTVSVLVDFTPVDTTKAVSNWLVGRGKPRRAIIKAHFPGKGGSTAAASRQEAKFRASQRIRGRRTRPIFVSNNVPYIDELNAGKSDQAPANFIEMALMEARQTVRRTPIFQRARSLSR